MAAIPTDKLSRVSQAAPNAGVEADIMDDDTVKFRRVQSSTHYGVRLVWEWVTQAEMETLVDFPAVNGFGPHTFTLKGVDYVGTMTNEPAVVDHKGALYMVEAEIIALRA